MSVQRIQVHVTKTLTAPTVTVLTAVLVNKDLMEMGTFAKVKKNVCINFNCKYSNTLFLLYQKRLFIFFLSVPSDFDECSLEPTPCDNTASCTNTEGSFTCTCKQGFTGNGTVCEGI